MLSHHPFCLPSSTTHPATAATPIPQARRFNEDDTGYDVLVASDAIGMGLNLNIRRIVFHSLLKKADDNSVTRVEPGEGGKRKYQ